MTGVIRVNEPLLDGGEKKSIPQGESQILCRQLTRRFGPLRIPVDIRGNS